jgi:hypothetical protein
MSEAYKKLEDTLTLWGMVQQENESHRHLVHEREWEAWQGHNATVSTKLDAIVERFDGKALSTEDEVYLDEVRRQISGAHRMSEQQLVERQQQAQDAAARAAEEQRLREQEAQLLVERKGLLRKLFKR